MKAKYSIFLILMLLGCSKIKVLDNPVTELNEIPSKINKSEYSKIMEQFNLENIEDVPFYYSGLSPKYPIALSIDFFGKSTNNCFEVSGGIIGSCNNLVLKIDSTNILIDNKQIFDSYFLPINDEKEALSYVSIITETIPRYSFDIKFRYNTYVEQLNKSYAKKVNNGYEVLTYDYDSFGCGPHYYYSVKSYIDLKGNIKTIEKKRIYKDPKMDGYCVD